MFEHFKGDEEFVRKVLDYKSQALNHQRMILTKFLNPHEQEVVHSLVGHELDIHEEGGYEGAENKRMIICPSFYEVLPEDYAICVYRIDYNDSFGKLKHKDVLGALMNLGIKRDCIGDIDDHDGLSFACAKENADYIAINLQKIKKSSVHLALLDERPTIIHEYTTKTFIVSSLRLDKVLAVVYGIPRSKSAEAIRSGLVKVNHKSIEEINYLCNNNDIISFQRHGRVKIVVTDRLTKQDNHVIEGLFYK